MFASHYLAASNDANINRLCYKQSPICSCSAHEYGRALARPVTVRSVGFRISEMRSRRGIFSSPAKAETAGPSVVQAIAEAANDSTRSGEERNIASDAVQQLGLRSITPSDNTFVLSSSSRNQVSMESSKLRGGVFTYYLVRGLSGEASLRKDGSIRPSELGLFVSRSIRRS